MSERQEGNISQKFKVYKLNLEKRNTSETIPFVKI